MRQALLIYGAAAIIASSLFTSIPSSAKTVKACEEEWKVNKTAIQSSGKKKKDFITECRAETAAAEPQPAATAPQAAPAEPPAPAQRKAKTVRACAAEWTANKAALESSGKTRKDFITECRTGTETTAAAAVPSEGVTPAKAATPAGRKTVKACEGEWKENKAAIQASGKRKTDFMIECRAEPASNQAAAPAPSPAPAVEPKPDVAAAPQAAPQPQPKSEARATPAPASQGPTASLAAGEFPTEAEAKSHCPGDTIVWANTRSKIYHYASSHRYGHTKAGAYMCEKETAAAGIRAAKREKRL